MKLVCSQSDLNAHLSLVSRAIPSRPSHPILANVLLIAREDKQQVSLTAFDLSLGIQTAFAAEVHEGGEIALPAKLFNDIVSRLPGESISLDNEADEFTVNLNAASGRYQVRGMATADFPELPVVQNPETAFLPLEALTDGLRGTLFATSGDETKQLLTGVHLTAQNEALEFAATDGHRLAVVQTIPDDAESPTPIAETALDVTLPARALREVERLLAVRQSTEPLALKLDPGQVIFQWGDHCLTSRTLEGQYPAYRQLIPQQFQRQMTADRRSLLSALERIAVLADQRNNIVKFSMDADQQQVTISVDAQDVGSGREVIPAQITGDSLDIAFNVKYLTEGLKVFTTTDIQLQMNAAVTPVVMTPVGGMKMTYLVMPVQLRN
jgi:DNA polymerase III subunit beta